MASAGNPNHSGPFDMHKLFKPSTTPSTPNPNNPNTSPFTPSYPTPPSSFPPPTYSYPPQAAPFHQQHQYLPYSQQDHQFANMHHQRPTMGAYPAPQPPIQPPQNHNHGATLMALLGTNPSTSLESPAPATIPMPSTALGTSGSTEFSMPMTPSGFPAIPSAPPANMVVPQPTPSRLPSSKLPKGRRLIGDHVVYDVDVRFQGEVQPQLEVTPITKYVSDPGLVLGRQIAVNRLYICYGLKLGAIRVLNINSALRALLRGHTQRVTDMAFFNEEVHLLASASIDGRIFVWKINEGPDNEDKPQITGKIILAIQIVGEGEPVHPRVCWYSHKQEVLIVGIGKRVLKIDTTKVGKGVIFTAEEPLKCPIENLIDGVQLVGKHEGEVTDLSMCQWMTTRLVSASSDGTVKIWEDRKTLPLAVLRPHDDQPVNSAKFLAHPNCPEHIILITAGPLNREVKIWASANEEGWLLSGDAESWRCIQTLDLRSSTETCNEDAFFNQVVALPGAGLILLANAKKNAIYAVHIEYGPFPAATRMDYIAEFTVTMPILSLTGTNDVLPGLDHVVQVYCVQTQAIQQYALDLSQCLPAPLENIGLEKTDSNASWTFQKEASQGSASLEMPAGTAEPKQPISISESASTARYPVSSGVTEVPSLQDLAPPETKQSTLPSVVLDAGSVRVALPTPPLSPRLSGRSSGFRTPTTSFEPSSPMANRAFDQPFLDCSVDRRVDVAPTSFPDVSSIDEESRKGGNNVTQNDISMVPAAPIMFKHPTHLITPSEILSRTVTSSESTQVTQGLTGGGPKVQDVPVSNDTESVEVEVKVVGEAETHQHDSRDSQRESHNLVPEKTEKSFYSQASDLNGEMARECRALSAETLNMQETRQINDSSVTQARQSPSAGEENFQESSKGESEAAANAQTSATKGKKQKGKQSQISGSSQPSPSPFNSTDSSVEPGCSTDAPSAGATLSQVQAMHETLNQLMTMQKEMQKQMSAMVAVPVNKEGKRLEGALGKSMEKAIKANSDAVWARFQEENGKHEKVERERTQQITSLITNFMNKELPAMLERTLKKELSAVGQAVARVVTPAVEKSISSSISDSFQKGVGDKAVNQLEKSVNLKLEATVAKQIQSQFQTSVKQALQDVLRSSLEASVIPAFEISCKAMFEQVDATFQKGMTEHTSAVQQQFESMQSPLTLALREAINSATSITRTLSGELADGQRKLMALAAAGASSQAVNPLPTQISNGPHEMLEVPPLDPTIELSRLISEHKFEEAFTSALQRSDVVIVSWLCSKVDLQKILSMSLTLSQGVLLALLQQLACDISTETARKLTWMTDVLGAINPSDPMISNHVRPIFEQVYQILAHHRTLPATSSGDSSSIRLLMHVLNSMLMSCK